MSHTAEKAYRMFSPELTNEMWINCWDTMAPAASYERTHSWHGANVGPNWSRATTAHDLGAGPDQTPPNPPFVRRAPEEIRGLLVVWEGGVNLSQELTPNPEP